MEAGIHGWRLGSRLLAGRVGTARAICTVAVFAIVFWSNPTLSPVYAPDTEGYLAVAKSLSSPQARDRPPGYPLFLSLAEGVGGTAWPHAVVLAQMALLAGIASSLFGIFVRGSIPPNRAAVAAVFCSVTPGLIGLTSCMLPEILLAFLLTLCWSRSLHLVTETRPFGRDLVASAVACGALSGAAALVKPVWVLGILPLAAGVALGRRKTSSSWAGLAVLMIAAHVALVGSWQIFLAREFGQWKISRVGTAAMNLAAIRAGMTGNAEGSPLYRYLERTGLLEEALKLRWQDFERFTGIKDAIPWEERTDPVFARQVLRRDPAGYVLLQLRRLPTFFTVSPPPFARSAFSGMPAFLRGLYARCYAAVFRIEIGGWRVSVLAILIVLGSARSVRSERLRPIVLTGVLVAVYYSVVVTLLTYQDPLFIRMRVPCEPLLLAVAIAPFLLSMQPRDDTQEEKPAR